VSSEPFIIVVNEEEQYSVWPAERALPLGWSPVGAAASKEECLAEIERRWTDLRPRSLRDAMNGPAKDRT
jgi:MbtH protein